MQITPFIVVIALVGGDGKNVEKSNMIEARVGDIVSERTAWQERCRAEDELKNYPGKAVLEALLPHIGKGMPGFGIWNSGGRDFDKRAPVKWQIFYAVHRSWDHHIAKFDENERPEVLLELLIKSKKPFGRVRILDYMTRYWTPKAEKTLAGYLRNGNLDFGTRREAGLVLMLHKGKKYHEPLRELAEKSTGKEHQKWLKILLSPHHKREVGVDPKVVAIAFKNLIKEKKTNPNYIHGAYFMACHLEGYLDKRFRPDERRKEYQGKAGLKERFFEETVANALRWWQANKKD